MLDVLNEKKKHQILYFVISFIPFRRSMRYIPSNRPHDCFLLPPFPTYQQNHLTFSLGSIQLFESRRLKIWSSLESLIQFPSQLSSALFMKLTPTPNIIPIPQNPTSSNFQYTSAKHVANSVVLNQFN
jgi:hypothetical protein